MVAAMVIILRVSAYVSCLLLLHNVVSETKGTRETVGSNPDWEKQISIMCLFFICLSKISFTAEEEPHQKETQKSFTESGPFCHQKET
jgi:hypothetical protein